MAASVVTEMVDVITSDFNGAFGIASGNGHRHVQRGSRNELVDDLVFLEFGFGHTSAFDFNLQRSSWWSSPFAVDNIPVSRPSVGEVASRILEIICLVSSLGIKGISLHGPNKREGHTSSTVDANNGDGINSIGSKIAKELIRCRGRHGGCSSSSRCVGNLERNRLTGRICPAKA